MGRAEYERAILYANTMLARVGMTESTFAGFQEHHGIGFACPGEVEENLVNRDTVFVGSSRLTRKLDEVPQLFDALLKIAIQLNPETDVLLTGEGTACDRMVRRLGQLFQIPVVELKLAPSNSGKLKTAVEQSVAGRSREVLVFDPDNRGIDFALSMIAKRMTVLSLRKNGKLHTAVSRRLELQKWTRILVDDNLTQRRLTDHLLGQGATGWYLYETRNEFPVEKSQTTPSHVSDFEAGDFLLHWTRRRVGPWPEQTENEFLDDLIFRSSRKDHREVAALRRILATGRIMATNSLTRDPRPVVCFSDVTFDQLRDLRVFRSHLSRWDFEPYGIAIRKTWLQNQGAAAVTYGDEALWESMTEKERPFFQLADPNARVDWKVEREWRAIGDVELCQIPRNAAVVFVPTEQEAAEIAPFSRWPVVCLNASDALGSTD